MMSERNLNIEKERYIFRKAKAEDLPAIAEIYSKIHEEEKKGSLYVGWLPGVYPTADTAKTALKRQDLFACEEEGNVLASAIINQCLVDVYEEGDWTYCGSEEEVMVLHTLAVSPNATRRGLGSAFVKFYEEYAIQKGCSVLRMDTNERNTIARKLYRKLGYLEAGIVPCEFNGIPGVNLVLLEKKL